MKDMDWKRLVNWLEGKGRALVAFSGGVDSALVAAAAKEALDNDVMSVTFRSEFTGDNEVKGAIAAARFLNAEHRVIQIDLSSKILENPPQRCYYCKKIILEKLTQLKTNLGFTTVVDGTNSDDLKMDRPGLRALDETDTKSPLAELGLEKKRHYSVESAPWFRI